MIFDKSQASIKLFDSKGGGGVSGIIKTCNAYFTKTHNWVEGPWPVPFFQFPKQNAMISI